MKGWNAMVNRHWRTFAILFLVSDGAGRTFDRLAIRYPDPHAIPTLPLIFMVPLAVLSILSFIGATVYFVRAIKAEAARL